MNDRFAALRQAAEAHLARASGGTSAEREWERAKLVHELLVLQTELEMQNEELRRAQLELTRSRDRYQRLYELAPVAHVTLHERGTVVESNARAAALLGVDRDSLLGRALQSFLPEASADVLHRHLREVFATGTRHSCDVSLSPHGAAGPDVPVHVDSIACDDTALDRRVCQSAITNVAEIRSAVERLQLAKVASGVGLWSWNAATGARSWDEESRAMLGASPADAGDARPPWAALVHREDRPAVERALRDAVAGAPFAVRCRVLRQDGTVAHLVARGTAVVDAGGRLASMTGAFVDVTREELSSELSRIAVEASPTAMLLVDRGGRVVLANERAATLFGYDGGELVGIEVDALTPPAVRSLHAELRHGFFAAPSRRPMGPDRELRGVRRDGREIPLEIGLAPVELATGPGVLAAITDIAERQELQAKLSQAERLAAVGELAAGVAHEINNPVNTMINCAQLAIDGDDVAQNCRIVVEEGERITEIVKSLLQFARDDRGRTQPTSLGDVLARTMRLFGESLKRHGIRVEIDVPDGLSPVQAHPQQLQQVLLNLLMNAKDALQQVDADRNRVVAIAARVTEGGVLLIVRDNGPGIAPDLLPRVFEPFVTTKRARGGTGLGLSVSRGIVEGFGGTIAVQSVPGESCEFTVALRRAPSE